MLDVIEAIRAKAAVQGFAPAIINGERVIPFQILLDLIARVGNHLIDRRVPHRARLYINVRDPDLRLITSLGAIYAGMIPLVLGDAAGLGAGLDYDFVVGSQVPLSPGLPADIVVDESVLAGSLSDGTLRPMPDLRMDDVLFVAGTSGTTGRPKLVAEKLSGFLKNVVDSEPRVTDADIVLITIGDSTKYGFGLTLRLLQAGAAVLRHDDDPGVCLRFVNLYGATRILATPAQLGQYVEVMRKTGVRAPSVQSIHLVGSLASPQLVRGVHEVFGVPFQVLYGSSETGGISRGLLDPDTFKTGYVGELFPGVELLDPGSAENPVPIVVARRNVIADYFVDGRPLVDRSPSHAMPDIGYLEGTSLYLVGRRDEVANLSGNKVAFAILEQTLREVPGIADVGLANIPPDWGFEGVVVGIAGDQVETAGLAERLAAAARTSFTSGFHIVRLPAVPRNATGKVDRESLLAEFRKTALDKAQ